MRSRPTSRSRDARAKSPSSSTGRRMSRTRWAASSPNVRQRDLSGASLEEHAAQSFLQFLDLHRHSRLRDRTCFGRASEVAVTCQRIEIAKLPKRDMGHQKNLTQRSVKSTLPDGFRSVVTREPEGMSFKTRTGGQHGRHDQVPVFGRGTHAEVEPGLVAQSAEPRVSSTSTLRCPIRWARRSITLRG